MIRTPLLWLYTRTVQALDQSVGWLRMPLLLGLVMLIAMRIILRQQNFLYDTTGIKLRSSNRSASVGGGARYLAARTADGTWFERNAPLKYAYPNTDAAILTPNPSTVSLELLARDTFQPVTTLNLLAAAWIQFMIHDWLSHGKNQQENPWKVPLAEDDPWPEHPMTILRTHSDPISQHGTDSLPPTYLKPRPIGGMAPRFTEAMKQLRPRCDWERMAS